MTIHQDTPYLCVRDLFHGTTMRESDEKMIELGSVVEKWLHEHSAFKGHIQWMNMPDSELNPDGTYGFFRFIHEIKETQ